MLNINHEICSDYLRYKLKCEFVEQNFRLPGTIREIDLMGLNLSGKSCYICDVQSEFPFQLLNCSSSELYDKLRFKFDPAIDFAKTRLPQYDIQVMFWCPILSRHVKYSCDPFEVFEQLRTEFGEAGLSFVPVINASYQQCLMELKSIASKEKTIFSTPAMKLLRLEGLVQSQN